MLSTYEQVGNLMSKSTPAVTVWLLHLEIAALISPVQDFVNIICSLITIIVDHTVVLNLHPQSL